MESVLEAFCSLNDSGILYLEVYTVFNFFVVVVVTGDHHRFWLSGVNLSQEQMFRPSLFIPICEYVVTE